MLTTEKTWQYGTAGDPTAHVNQNVYNSDVLTLYRNMWLAIKNSMIGVPSSPWEVVASCDSVNYPLGAYDGIDRWLTGSDLVWGNSGGSQVKSWIILEQPGLGGAQVLFACEVVTYNYYYWDGEIRVSWSGSFSGGDNYVLPTAPDVITIRNNDQIWYGNHAYANSYVHVMVSSDGECTRIFGCANGYTSMFMLFDKAKVPEAGWSPPVVAVHYYDDASNADCTNYNFNDNAWLKSRIAGVNANLYLATIGYDAACHGEYIGGINTQLNEWEVYPMWLCCPTAGAKGTKGMLYDLGFATVSASIGTGDVYPPGGPYTHAQFGQFVVPWPNVVPQIT